MSGFLLDTNIPSELVRPQPEPKVRTWVAAQSLDTLFISSVSFGELRKGIFLQSQDRREELAGLGINKPPSLSRVNPRGTLEEYYGAPWFIVLTYTHADEDSGVARSARYSKELFEHVIRQLEGR